MALACNYRIKHIVKILQYIEGSNMKKKKHNATNIHVLYKPCVYCNVFVSLPTHRLSNYHHIQVIISGSNHGINLSNNHILLLHCFVCLLGCMGVLHYTVMPFPNYAFIHVSRQIRKKLQKRPNEITSWPC